MITYLSTVTILRILPFMQFYQCPQNGVVRNVMFYNTGEPYQYQVEIVCSTTVQTKWIDAKLVKIKESK